MAVRFVPNLGIELLKILKPICAVCDCPRAVWVVNCKICKTNCIAICMRPEMATKFEFTK